MEHLQHFGLSDDPFSNQPTLALWCETPLHADAEKRLLRGAQQGKGLVLLVGAPGTGKTLLLRRLLDGLSEERFEAGILMMMPGDVTPGGLLARIARQLGVDAPAAERRALLAQLYAGLVELQQDGRHAVVMVDGAELLEADAGFADLRGLLDLEHDERHLLTLVLAGPPELERALAGDPSLGHRVEIKVRLGPLDETGARAFLAHRLGAAGGSLALFEEPAVTALVRASGGVPRLLNTLADNALYEAHLALRASVRRDDVARAAGDLGLAVDAPADGATPAGAPSSADAARLANAAAQVAPPRPARAPDLTESLRGSAPLGAANSTTAAAVDAAPGLLDAADEGALHDAHGEIAWGAEVTSDPSLADVFEAPPAPGEIETALAEAVPEPTEPEILPVFESPAGWSGDAPSDGPPKEEEIEELFDQLLEDGSR